MTSLTPRSRFTSIAAAGLAVTAVLALGACTGESSSTSTPAPETSASSAAAAPAPSSRSAASASSASPSSSDAESSSASASTTAALLAAGATAEEKTSAIVSSIESDDNGAAWEVHVIGNDGSEQKLVLSANGKSVTSGPTVESVDTDDRAENQRYAAVNVDYQRAVAAIDKEVPGGSIDEIHLDTEGSTIVWEADVTAGTESRTVQLDAGTGAVVSNKIGN